ncbi:unnamed protein product [Effrenium voratum]|nr:unnamed protein product [Effrenium voratum]
MATWNVAKPGPLTRQTPALLFSLEVRQRVWGVSILESPQNPGKDVTSIWLYPPQSNTSIPALPEATANIRGELLLALQWTEAGAQVDLHLVRSLALPVSRLYELKHQSADPDAEVPALWTLQIWGLPPSAAKASAGIPLCKVEITEPGPIPFTQHSFELEKSVQIQWPENWAQFSSFGSGEAKAETLSFQAVCTADPWGSLVMRCRHAMFEGATVDGASARSLKHWADLESWFLFGPLYARYDDELLPIDEVTALHNDFALSTADIMALRADDSYMVCHASVVRFVLLSWGWDIESGERVLDMDEDGGQGWEASGSHAWRLRHLCLSCWLLGQDDLRQACKDFVLSLDDPPWVEDGFSEAVYTLQDGAEAFWQSRPLPKLSGHLTADQRTLQGILLAEDILHVDPDPVSP